MYKLLKIVHIFMILSNRGIDGRCVFTNFLILSIINYIPRLKVLYNIWIIFFYIIVGSILDITVIQLNILIFKVKLFFKCINYELCFCNDK